MLVALLITSRYCTFVNVAVRHFQPELAHVIPMKLVVVVVIGRGSTMLAAVTKTHSFTSGQFTSSQTRVLQKNLATNKNMVL